MQHRIPFIFAGLIAAAGVIASSAVLSAQPEIDGMPQGPRHSGFERPGHGGRALPPGLGRGVRLNDEQQQKAFAIRHAAEPQLFALMARVRKAQDTLHQLAQAPGFDEAKVNAAASELGAATAASALVHARLGAQMAALLTAEQRAALDARPAKPVRQ